MIKCVVGGEMDLKYMNFACTPTDESKALNMQRMHTIDTNRCDR